MDRGVLRYSFGLAALILAACPVLRAVEDCVIDPKPNPFREVLLEPEGKGQELRHYFHKMRVTWTNYFKVWAEPREDHQVVTLQELKAEPKFFLHRKVEFSVYLNGRGSFFRQMSAPFTRDTHVNISAWPYGTELWDREQREDIYPFLYIGMHRDELIRKVDAMPKFTPVHFWGKVESINNGYCWIDITDAELMSETPHTLKTLRNMELATNRLLKKDWSLAAANYREAIQTGLPLQTTIRAYEGLGRALMEMGQYSSAREALVEGLEIYGNPREKLADVLKRDERCVQTLVMLAQCDSHLGRNDEAKTCAELAIEMVPSNAVAHAELGLALARLGDVRKGLWELAAAERLAPRTQQNQIQLPEAHRNRGQVYILQDKWEDALGEYDTAVTQRPSEGMYHVERGDVLMHLKKYADAENAYNAAVDILPTRPEPLNLVALAVKSQGDEAKAGGKAEDATKLYEKAIEKVKGSLRIDDTYAPAYGTYAEILRAMGKEEDAKKILEEGAKANPRSSMLMEVLYDQAKATGDWEAMELAASKAVLLNPNDASQHLRLADLLASRPEADWCGAEKEYDVATRLEPSNADAWVKLAHARTVIKDWRGGVIAGVQAVNRAPENGGAWSDLAACRSQIGDVQGSVVAAEEAFRFNDTDMTKVSLAKAYVDRQGVGDVDKAYALAKVAAAEAADANVKAGAHCVLGAILHLKGQHDEALEAFAASEPVANESAWHHLWKGRCELDHGNYEAARTSFDKAASLAAGDGTASVALSRIQEAAVKESKDVAKAEKKGQKEGTHVAAQKTAEDRLAVEEAPKEPVAKEPVEPQTTESDTKPAAQDQSKAEEPKNSPPKIQVQPASTDEGETSVKTR